MMYNGVPFDKCGLYRLKEHIKVVKRIEIINVDFGR